MYCSSYLPFARLRHLSLYISHVWMPSGTCNTSSYGLVSQWLSWINVGVKPGWVLDHKFRAILRALNPPLPPDMTVVDDTEVTRQQSNGLILSIFPGIPKLSEANVQDSPPFWGRSWAFETFTEGYSEFSFRNCAGRIPHFKKNLFFCCVLFLGSWSHGIGLVLFRFDSAGKFYFQV